MHQRVFLSITAGPTPKEAAPVLATEDRDVIRAAVEAIRARVGYDDDGQDSRGRAGPRTSNEHRAERRRNGLPVR